MPRKRNASAVDVVAAPKRRVPPKPKSLKDRIVSIVTESSIMLGAPTIKKKLVHDFGLVNSRAFNTNVNKALKELADDDDRKDFGKCGGSYHAGPTSAAYLAHVAKETEAGQLEAYKREGRVLCCHCNQWTLNEFIREDYVARGAECLCCGCNKTYFTWISDGYTEGHEVEYRFGDGREEYKQILGKDFNTPLG
ncbi:hypothetical protein DYB30_004240 [Aphanomyces astaci]|uniref:Uncharacterized protein n=4 Tax=Aphanomyces astaci TaxID=112090 RepID=A0A397D2G6_APHAT|nr:hypothetical protein DYB38_006304 [Aphanomyces astaci]RHY59625.1 hypothetical protein DYB30_004240 [Aphanomyces astaci]